MVQSPKAAGGLGLLISLKMGAKDNDKYGTIITYSGLFYSLPGVTEVS